jgi:hypothetical protein
VVFVIFSVGNNVSYRIFSLLCLHKIATSVAVSVPSAGDLIAVYCFLFEVHLSLIFERPAVQLSMLFLSPIMDVLKKYL